MILTCRVYKCCERVSGDNWRVVDEGNKEKMRSAVRAAKREGNGKSYCLVLSMCAGIGDCVNLSVP